MIVEVIFCSCGRGLVLPPDADEVTCPCGRPDAASIQRLIPRARLATYIGERIGLINALLTLLTQWSELDIPFLHAGLRPALDHLIGEINEALGVPPPTHVPHCRFCGKPMPNATYTEFLQLCCAVCQAAGRVKRRG